MKKVLSIVLTAMMLLSMVSVASAATLSEKLTNFPTSVALPLNSVIRARQGGTQNAYSSNSLQLTLANGSSIGVDYEAELDMEPVRNVFNGYTISAILADGTALAEFDAATVTTTIDVAITYPAATTISNINTAGVLDAGDIFSETGRVVAGNTVTITFENRTPLTGAELRANKDSYLKNIKFTIANEASYNTTGTHQVSLTMTGNTIIDFAEARNQEITYLSSAVHETVITQSPIISGNEIIMHTLTYETNGGNKILPEQYTTGKTVKLTKVPVKEGYVFEGWYLDEALTKEVKEIKMLKNTVVYAAWVEDNGSAGGAHEIPKMLNGQDHFAYIVGYPDGTVKPNANISRAEVTSVFFRLLIDEVRDQNLISENSFTDISSDAWYNTAISTMAKLGIINGKDNDTFAPDAPITRAEFATICARFDDSEYEIADNFTDIAGHWAEAYIHEAAAHGWIRGYENGTFKPDQLITRAEAMTMINRIVKRVPETVHDMLDSMTKWPDNSDHSAWYYTPVQEATNGHEHEMKNNIYETWKENRNSRDWTEYEK